MRLLITILLFLFQAIAVAQQLPMDTYTPANGLVDTRLIKMFQDSRGRIYFLTREGFSIYDGRHFDNYANESNDRTEIINGITEYSSGLVRLFSFDGNLYNVNGTAVTADTTHRQLLAEVNNVFDIGPNDKLIVTNNFIVREKNGQYEKLKTPFAGEDYLRVADLVFCKPYLLLSHYKSEKDNTVFLYNYETQQSVDSLPGHFFFESATDKQNNIYLRMAGWLQLENTALKNGKIRIIPAAISRNFPAAYKDARLFFDDENNAWLCSNDKGFCRVSAGGEIAYFNSLNGVLEGASAVFQDAEKNIWLASAGNGVQKLQRSSLSKVQEAGNNTLGYVKALNTDENGAAFIHSLTGYYLDGKRTGSKNISLSTPVVYWQNQYWHFSDYKTLTGSRGTVFHLEDFIPGYKPADFKLSFPTIDREGRLVIAGNNILIIGTDLKLHVFHPEYFCDKVVVDGQNNYWLFLRSNRVIKASFENGGLKPVYNTHFLNLNPRYALQWNDSTFIVATRLKGIQFFTWKNNQLHMKGGLDKTNGLSNNFAYTLLKKNNRLLVGTGGGLDLVSFNGIDTVIENLSLRNNVFSPFVSAVLLKDSSALCLTGDGQLFKLAKETTLSSPFIPRPYFRSIEVNGVVADSSGSFPYNKNNFSFSISAPSFLDNKNMKYSFVLLGNGQQWKQNSGNADFTINNLSPGNYTLKVTVTYPGKFYADQELGFSFTIEKPFWQRWWFILLAAAAFAGTVIYLIQNYFRRKLEKQKILLEKELAIEQERTRVARELHDGLGSMLSGLKHSFTALQNQLGLDENQQQKFNLNIERLNDSIKELRNISNSMYTDNSLKYGLENSLRDYCHFITESSGLQVSFTALQTNNIQLSEEQSFHIFRIVQELLQNIIKHAGAKTVIVQLSCHSGRLYITVEDDGSGFDITAAKQQKSMGLKNIDARVKILNAAVDYNTAANKGTSVTLEIPLKKSD